MAKPANQLDTMPVICNPEDFDKRSGNIIERLVFNNRLFVVIACLVLTIALGFESMKLTINSGYDKMLPQDHPYIQNYFTYQDELRGLGNSIRVVVEAKEGGIFDPDYMELLQQINDELFLTKGVDRSGIKSLWTPSVRWTEVNESGFAGGPVIPNNYDGSPKSLEQLKFNIARAGIVGQLVANNFKSSMIFVPLLDKDPKTGERLDYTELSKRLDTLRVHYEQGSEATDKTVNVHIIGFAKLVGDLIDGLGKVAGFFLVSAVIAMLLIYQYTRCVRSTTLVIICSFLAVVWQLGIIRALGFVLDPFSILVPFLIFAIGVSHGAQKMNGIMQDIGRGTHRLVAARYTFRRLFLAGLTALLADAVGFAVLMTIDIPVIQDLALTASIGVAVLIFTNLLLLPVVLSYTGVSAKAAARSLKAETLDSSDRGIDAIWRLLERFTERRWAVTVLLITAMITSVGFYISLDLKIGDLDPGAPELRPDSRYNLDNAFINANYALSSDMFAVIVKTPTENCLKYTTLLETDRLAWQLQQLPSVQATVSLVNAERLITAGSYEGNLKWFTLSRNQDVLNYGAQQAYVNNPSLFNTDCSIMPLIAYLSDHKADSLTQVVDVVASFAEKNNREDLQFLLAAGNSGIEATTNIVVKDANRKMLLYVYAAVIVLCFITFRSWRAVVVAVLPLMVTSILCEALMVVLGIGVKVSTLPVVALGVGIGIDYALYLLSVQLMHQRMGMSLVDAYKNAVMFTGKVVGLVGTTLAAGVVTWIFAPIKFQADMGILLTFMLVWNMLGALILIPALSHFILPCGVASLKENTALKTKLPLNKIVADA